MAAAKKGGRGDMVLESRHLFGLFVLLAVLFGVVFTLGYLLGHGQGDTQGRLAAVHTDDNGGAVTSFAASSATAPAAAAPAADTKPASSAATGTDWSYYHAGDPGPSNDVLEPAAGSKPAKPAGTGKPSSANKPAGSTKPGSTSQAAASSSAKPASNSAASSSATKPAAKPAAGAAPNVAIGSPMVPKGAIVLQVAALEKESDALAMAQALEQRKFPAFVLPAGADQYYRVQVGPYATAEAAAAAQKQLESQGFKSIVKR